LVDEWSFPSTDLEIIKKDWETITKKIADGKAHELSEGDTFYLGACTKGANASSVRKQPFSRNSCKTKSIFF
jgi:DNA mismatch repair protein MutH